MIASEQFAEIAAQAVEDIRASHDPHEHLTAEEWLAELENEIEQSLAE